MLLARLEILDQLVRLVLLVLTLQFLDLQEPLVQLVLQAQLGLPVQRVLQGQLEPTLR